MLNRLKQGVKRLLVRNKYYREYHHYKHLASHFEQKYLTANHWLKEFRTQFAPGHFYSPYPDLREINKRKETIFDRTKRNIPGIDIRERQQVALLRKLAKHYPKMPHLKLSKSPSDLRYKFGLHAYSYTDAVVLFCMILQHRPKRIIEIGSGYSSALMLDINEQFFDNSMRLTFVEPFPQLLKSLTKPSDTNQYTLENKPLWQVDRKLFRQLEKDDILFIDSTHVSKAGSDVNQLFFEVLPHLKKGVIVHIHDIFYPFEYPIEWVKETRAWTEDYIVRAFLYNNEEYEIVFFNHFMNIHHKAEMDSLLPETRKNSGGSLWLRKVV